MNKEKKQMLNDFVKDEDNCNKKFLLHLNNIFSDLLFVVSFFVFYIKVCP